MAYRWYGYSDDRDLAEMRRAANANIQRVMSGQYRREMEETRARNLRDRELAKKERLEARVYKKALREELIAKRKEMKELQRDYQYLYDAHDAGTISKEDYGALEEIDHRINDVLVLRINEIDEELWQMKR